MNSLRGFHTATGARPPALPQRYSILAPPHSNSVGWREEFYIYFPLRPTLKAQEGGVWHSRLQTPTFMGLSLGAEAGKYLW
jgi:hypothetical protein